MKVQQFVLIAIKDTVTQEDDVDDNPLSVLHESFQTQKSFDFDFQNISVFPLQNIYFINYHYLL